MTQFPWNKSRRRQTVMMCPPDHFGVNYVINDWMQGNCGKTDATLAQMQWMGLKSAVSDHADVIALPPQPGLPDMVFTANAALIVDDIAVISRFRNPERQGEEQFFEAFLRNLGFRLPDWPNGVFFEGAGDALIDRGDDVVWAGHGFRTDRSAHPLLADILSRRVIGLNLIDPRFYHLDTCLCPLDRGYMMYYPAAFDDESRQLIESHVPPERRIAVDAADAAGFACNAVDLDGCVIMNTASEKLQNQLLHCGFQPIITPLSEFHKAGGAAKCLTLKLLDDTVKTKQSMAA